MVSFVSNSDVYLYQATENIDQSVAHAARVSIKGFDQPETFAGSLIHRLYRDKHMSCFEHNSITFRVRVPIFVSRELVRHRSLSFNEESARYKEMAPVFYVPPGWRPVIQRGKAMEYELVQNDMVNGVAAQAIMDNSVDSWTHYQRLLQANCAREVARMVLPVNLMTSLYVTGNLREWLMFLDLRADGHALQEIREVALRIADQLAELAPVTMEAWRTSE